MQFVIVQPDEVAATAAELAGVATTVAGRNAAAAAPTTAVAPAAADQVSALTAAKFTAFGRLWQMIGSQAVANLHQLVDSLHSAAESYASTDTDNAGALQEIVSALGANITAPNSGNTTTGLDGILNVLSGTVDTPIGNLFNANGINTFVGADPWDPALIINSSGDMAGLAYILGRTVVPVASATSMAFGSAGASLHSGILSSPPAGLGAQGVLAGAHSAALDGSGELGNATSARQEMFRASKVGPHYNPAGPLGTFGAAATVGSTTPRISPAAGAAILPGVSMPCTTVRRRTGRFARRYGFRPRTIRRPAAIG